MLVINFTINTSSNFLFSIFLTAEQPAIVVILTASEAGKFSLRFTVSYNITSNFIKMFSTADAVCIAAGR
jgi:ABC-type arginine transport system ATPase subunit